MSVPRAVLVIGPAMLWVGLLGCVMTVPPGREPAPYETPAEAARDARRNVQFWDRMVAARERESQRKKRGEERARERADAMRRASVVAVFDFAPNEAGFDDRTLEAAGEYLAIQLAATGAFAVVPRSEIRARLVGEKRDSYRACYDESCQIELGKAVAAEKSLAPKLLRVGDECALDLTLYDLRAEAAERGATVRTPCSDEKLLDGIDRVVAELVASEKRLDDGRPADGSGAEPKGKGEAPRSIRRPVQSSTAE